MAEKQTKQTEAPDAYTGELRILADARLGSNGRWLPSHVTLVFVNGVLVEVKD